MPIRIPGRRAGRPDYSKTSTIPIISPQPSGVQQLYWSGYDDIPGDTIRVYIPVDKEYNTFPRAGKTVRTRRVTVTLDADTLTTVYCLHIPEEAMEKYLRGEITTSELLFDYSFPFKVQHGYQQVIIEVSLYPIRGPDVFGIAVGNADTNTHRFWFSWEGEES